jgi:hypothetical protein
MQSQNSVFSGVHTLIYLKGEIKGKNPDNFNSGYKALLQGLYGDILNRRKHLAWEQEEERKLIAKMESDIKNHGAFNMRLFSRDCDCHESTSLCTFESIEEYEECADEVFDCAEGETHFTYISHLAAQEFEGSSRDRVMEAFENGGGNFFL